MPKDPLEHLEVSRISPADALPDLVERLVTATVAAGKWRRRDYPRTRATPELARAIPSTLAVSRHCAWRGRRTAHLYQLSACRVRSGAPRLDARRPRGVHRRQHADRARRLSASHAALKLFALTLACRLFLTAIRHTLFRGIRVYAGSRAVLADVERQVVAALGDTNRSTAVSTGPQRSLVCRHWKYRRVRRPKPSTSGQIVIHPGGSMTAATAASSFV